MFYSALRPALFSLSAETAHSLAISALALRLVPPQKPVADARLANHVFGLDFANPVGLAAGFDKNAAALPALQQQGFGFVECGTVTPLPQPGNPKPRMFRLEADYGVINRLGFNNDGLEGFVKNLAHAPRHIPIGANIGKNKDQQDAVADYRTGLQKVYAHSDYVTINISSPNTAGLRDLQEKHRLAAVLDAMVETRAALQTEQCKRVPLLLKIAPDLTAEDTADIAALLLEKGLDGCIISNTTIARPDTLKSANRKESGGLSGQPLRQMALEKLREVYRLTEGKIPLVGVGGIATGRDAYARIRAGASLVQLYSALAYEGFGIVTRINRELAALLEKDGFASIKDAIGAETRT